MKSRVKIPVALQIVMDDIGWFNGTDDRCVEGPSRTGMPRMHAPEDYLVINEIGKGINQKINCPFVIGEWDRTNILRGMPHATNDEKGWDMASKMDMKLAEECFDAMESSEYIEYAVHGLMHGYWTDGISMADQEFSAPVRFDFKRKYAPAAYMRPVSHEYFESHIDTFFKIYNEWGFKKKIRSFTSPASVYGDIDDNRYVASVLKKYDIIHWSNYWAAVKDLCVVIDGVTFINKGKGMFLPWNAYGVDTDALPDYSFELYDGTFLPERAVFGIHWPNFLSYNPKKNLENVEPWVRYFNRQAEIFGIMISRDIAFASSQALYRKFSKLEFTENSVIIDLSDVDKQNSLAKSDSFYISLHTSLKPKSSDGGSISIYENHVLFNTYEIKRSGESVVKITV